jgi:hypothetical protein
MRKKNHKTAKLSEARLFAECKSGWLLKDGSEILRDGTDHPTLGIIQDPEHEIATCMSIRIILY